MMLLKTSKSILLVLMTITGFAHGDLHERIQLVTANIDRFPEDIDLYYQRGVLYLEHENYRAAIKDFRHCYKKGQVTARHYYALARAHYLSRNYRKCIKLLDLSMTIQLPDSKVFHLLSQAYEKRGVFDDAHFWAQKNLDEAKLQRPDHYLALAHIYELKYQKNQKVDILKRGIERFGLLPSLTSQLLQILVEQGDIHQAIQWQNKIVNSQARREFALFDRAELYLLIDNLPKAIIDLQQVQSMVNGLPKHIQNSEAVVKLLEKTGSHLQQIKMQDS